MFIVDDHPVLRQGLGTLINAQNDLQVCGEADSAPVAKTEVARCSPDVVIVDISLATGSGLELIKDLHYQHPGLPLLALSMHREELYGPRAIAAGAKGYVCKSEPVTNVLTALRRLLQGQLAVSEKVLGKWHPNTATAYNNLAGLYLQKVLFSTFARTCAFRPCDQCFETVAGSHF